VHDHSVGTCGGTEAHPEGDKVRGVGPWVQGHVAAWESAPRRETKAEEPVHGSGIPGGIGAHPTGGQS
jgi:hypothetical protein